MKKRYQNFKSFVNSLGKGMAVEWQETKEIPMLLWQKEYRKVGTQVVDICKMAALGVVWVIPGGAVLTAMIVKFSCKIRPSAFQNTPSEKSTEGYLKEFSHTHQNNDTQKPSGNAGNDTA